MIPIGKLRSCLLHGMAKNKWARPCSLWCGVAGHHCPAELNRQGPRVTGHLGHIPPSGLWRGTGACLSATTSCHWLLAEDTKARDKEGVQEETCPE